MRIIITSEARGVVDAEGRAWISASADYEFWKRYLDVFDQVSVMARLDEVQDAPANWLPLNGEGIEAVALPYYVGPTQYLGKRNQVRRCVQTQLHGDAAVLFRIPGQIGAVAHGLIDSQRPFAVEVVGDPIGVFAPGAVSHPLRRLLAWQKPRELRRIVGDAAAASYVTERTLQSSYPARPDAFTTFYSSIDLDSGWFADHSRRGDRTGSQPKILFVGSLEQRIKGADDLIKAVALLTSRSLYPRVGVVGGGKHREELELLARTQGVDQLIEFFGPLPSGVAIRERLDAADLFVLPSRSEGLPRVLIEAMARGLPCIGTAVSGIPELLPPEDLVPPNDPEALAEKIAEIVRDPARMQAMSARNLAKAADYRGDVLRERRNEFYRYIRDRTVEWQRSRRRE